MTIQGKLMGTRPPSDFWEKRGVLVPYIHCDDSNKPVFHESGYASGHANERLHVPGLLNCLKNMSNTSNQDQQSHTSYSPISQTGFCWAIVRWANGAESHVCLHHVYDGSKDVYTINN